MPLFAFSFRSTDSRQKKKKKTERNRITSIFATHLQLYWRHSFYSTMIRKRKLHCQNIRIRIGKGPMGTTIITRCKKISQVMQTKCGTIGLTVHTQLKIISRNSVSFDKRSVWFIRIIQRNLYGQMAQVGNLHSAICSVFVLIRRSGTSSSQIPRPCKIRVAHAPFSI